MEICIHDLKDFPKMQNVELKVSQPVVPFCETVVERSSMSCLAKSPNGHNRFYAICDPLAEGLAEAIESGQIKSGDDMKARARVLEEKFGWDSNMDARKIWAFGPEIGGTNILVDSTKGVAYMSEVRDSVEQGFNWAVKEGCLAEELVRGVRFAILDSQLHADVVHRGGGQIIPSARRVFLAAQMTAKPRLQEPVFLVDIQCDNTCLSGVYNVLSQKKGVVLEALPRIGTPLYQVKAYLPVVESFGFTAFLRANTSGKAFPQCVFDHWQVVADDPFEAGTRAEQIVTGIRKRKGLNPEIPPLDRFLDKL